MIKEATNGRNGYVNNDAVYGCTIDGIDMLGMSSDPRRIYGGTPDGIVNINEPLEIKCPLSETHIILNSNANVLSCIFITGVKDE